MGRPKTDDLWEEWVRKYTENEPWRGPLGIRKELEIVAQKSGRNDLPRIPSVRTIGRIQQRYRALPDEERQRYRFFRWPEDMENGLLPWEAGASALELLRWWREQRTANPILYGYAGNERPLVGQVRWFARVSSLMPDADFHFRYAAARWLSAAEVAGNVPIAEDIRRDVELFIAFHPWRSSADAEAYEAVLRDKRRRFPYAPFQLPDFDRNAKALADFMIAADAYGLPAESFQAVAEDIVQNVNIGEAEVPSCADTSDEEAQSGSPSSASDTTKTASGDSGGTAASRPRRPRRKS